MPHLPKIDPRGYKDIVKTLSLARLHGAQTETPGDDTGPHEGQLVAARASSEVPGSAEVDVDADPEDLADVLIHLFARMAVHVIERINRIPEKGFLAFLDLIGTQPLPPSPARVPLTFFPTPGRAGEVVVPSRTLVAGPAGAGGEEVVFETEEDLLVTSSLPVVMTILDPTNDRFARMELDDGSFALDLSGHRFLPIEHAMFLDVDDLLQRHSLKQFKVTLTSPQAEALNHAAIQWAFYDGSVWTSISSTTAVSSDGQSLHTTLAVDPAALKPLTLQDKTARWLRATTMVLPPTDNPPVVTRVEVMAFLGPGDRLLPDHAFANALPVDLSQDFFPFGEAPRFNDALYLASDAFSLPDAQVKIEVTVTNPVSDTASPIPPVRADGHAAVQWEVAKKDGTRVLLADRPRTTRKPHKAQPGTRPVRSRPERGRFRSRSRNSPHQQEHALPV